MTWMNVSSEIHAPPTAVMWVNVSPVFPLLQSDNIMEKLYKRSRTERLLLMDFQFGSTITTSAAAPTRIRNSYFKSPICSNNNNNNNNDEKGNNISTDWDKAWSTYKKQGKKSLFSQFNPNKYVSWNPRRSNYPLSEEVDPIKRAERSNLQLWTSPTFTLVGAIVVVSFLLIYTIIAPMK